MIWALVSTFIGSLVSIFRKKALCLTELKGLRFMIFGFSGGFLIGLIFLFLGKVDLSILTNLGFILVFISIVSIDIFGSKIEQGLYKKEKVSVLMPFESLQKIFIVIAGYFLFGNTSVFTLVITLITILVIILFNIDYKEFKLPKFLWFVIFVNFVWAVVAILENVMLKITNVQTFFALNDLIKVVFVSISIAFLFKNEALQIFKQTKNFYFFRFGAGIFGGVNFLITLFLISELGIVTTILLSFLGMVFKLIFSYFLLKEVPGRKDVILAFIVASLIGVGYYFG